MSRALALALLGVSGCAAPYLVGQTGRVTPARSFKVQAAAGVGVSTSAIDIVQDGIDAAEGLTKVSCGNGAECYRLEDLRPLVTAGYQAALFGPLFQHYEASVRYGVYDGFDLGAHFTSGTWRLDAGYQLSGPRNNTEEGWAASVFMGWNHHRVTAGEVLEALQLDDFGRDDFDLLAVHGRQFGEYLHVFYGGRYMASRWTLDLMPDLPAVDQAGNVMPELPRTDPSGWIHQVGALGGIAGGYKHVFLGGELNLVYYRGSAEVLGAEETFSGLAAFPALFLYGQF